VEQEELAAPAAREELAVREEPGVRVALAAPLKPAAQAWCGGMAATARRS
jgi:hypothetical protein